MKQAQTLGRASVKVRFVNTIAPDVPARLSFQDESRFPYQGLPLEAELESLFAIVGLVAFFDDAGLSQFFQSVLPAGVQPA